MPTIKFTTAAGLFDGKQRDLESGDSGLFAEDETSLRSPIGISYTGELFSDYLADGDETRFLAEIGVKGGQLSFVYSPRTRQLQAYTEYTIPQTLSDKEVQLLTEYTVGQWSDGIGSNFF